MSALRPRQHARHAAPSKAAPLLVAGGMTTALVVADGAALAVGASAHGGASPSAGNASPTGENFDRLAQCESGGRWNINTGNGYFGGLQFSAATWRGIGMTGLPHEHSRDVQISAGQKLQARSGWGQWPACSRKLGLRGGGGQTTAAAPAAAPAPPPRANRSRKAAVSKAPVSAAQVAFGGDVTTAASRTVREDVRAWQAQMKRRGWKITADGRFGPKSASVAQRFAAQKGLAATAGVLNAAVYGAAWSLPVS